MVRGCSDIVRTVPAAPRKTQACTERENLAGPWLYKLTIKLLREDERCNNDNSVQGHEQDGDGLVGTVK